MTVGLWCWLRLCVLERQLLQHLPSAILVWSFQTDHLSDNMPTNNDVVEGFLALCRSKKHYT